MSHYPDHHRHDHEFSDPDDIDGAPPPDSPGYPTRTSQAFGFGGPPSYGGAPHYFNSPPRTYPPAYAGEGPSERYIPPDFPRGQPPPGYPPQDFSRGPPAVYPPHEFPRDPAPIGYPSPEFQRRYPPRDYGPPEHSRGGTRYNAGFPPPLYEPGHGYPPPGYPAAPDRYPPPGYPQQRPPEVYSPERPPVNAGPIFPPLPYEPAAAVDPLPQGPPLVMPPDHERAGNAAAEFPPMPYEPAQEGGPMPYEPAQAGRPLPGAQYNPNAGYPPETVRYPPRGDEGVIPYNAAFGYPPFREGLYGRRRYFAGCKDYWAAFLFLVHFWAVVGICIYLGIRGIQKSNENAALQARELALQSSSSFNSTAPAPAPVSLPHLYSIRDWAPQLAAAAGAGWLFAWIWQSLIRLYPKTMIYACLSLGSFATGLLGIILISTGSAKGLIGLIFLVSALFQALYVHLVRQRVPFAAIMLSKVLSVTAKYPGLYFVSHWSVFVAMFWIALWIFGAAGAVSLKYGGYYAALLIISLAWSMEVLRNTVNVTVAGVVGTFYFQEHDMPPHPTMTSLRRAWTTSFGSICVGSMFVAIVQTLHSVAKSVANEQGGNEFLFSCVNCFLGLMEVLIRYFNKWAYVQVAIYEKSYVKAAKDTWHMFKMQRADMLVNDDLTGAVLFTGCIIGGVLTALVGGCWTFATQKHLTVGVSVISFFIGYFVTYLTMVVAESGVAAYYVCFAEEPLTLQKIDPPHYQYMWERKVYLEQQTAE